MNPLLPIAAGTVPVSLVVVMIIFEWMRAERRKAVVSDHVTKVLRGVLQRDAGAELKPNLVRKLVFERSTTSYRGYIPNPDV